MFASNPKTLLYILDEEPKRQQNLKQLIFYDAWKIKDKDVEPLKSLL